MAKEIVLRIGLIANPHVGAGTGAEAAYQGMVSRYVGSKPIQNNGSRDNVGCSDFCP